MHILTTDDVSLQPQRLFNDASGGELCLVTREGQPVLLTVPLGEGVDTPAVRRDLAAYLYDSEQIGLGLAARIAGLSYSEMIDDLGRRRIAVVRYSEDELAAELSYVDTLACR
jgi:predicted HTH domain antitoxin